MSLVPINLRPIFEQAGWFSGRRIAVNPSVPIGHPAYAVLANFGGLSLMRPDSTYKVCEVDFQYLPDKEDLPRRWEIALNTQLVGIAEHHNGHGELYMSSAGHIFGNSYIHDAFWYDGRNFQEAIENIMQGRRSRAMLLDDQKSVTLYGQKYLQGDPEVLHPSSPELLLAERIDGRPQRCLPDRSLS